MQDDSTPTGSVVKNWNKEGSQSQALDHFVQLVQDDTVLTSRPRSLNFNPHFAFKPDYRLEPVQVVGEAMLALMGISALFGRYNDSEFIEWSDIIVDMFAIDKDMFPYTPPHVRERREQQEEIELQKDPNFEPEEQQLPAKDIGKMTADQIAEDAFEEMEHEEYKNDPFKGILPEKPFALGGVAGNFAHDCIVYA